MDGLSAEWKKGVASDWEGDIGLHNHKDMVRHGNLPVAILELHNEQSLRNYDASKDAYVERGFDDTDFEEVSAKLSDPIGSDMVRDVTKLSQSFFTKKLVEHFDLMSEKKK